MKAYTLPIVLGLWVGLGHAVMADSGGTAYESILRVMGNTRSASSS